MVFGTLPCCTPAPWKGTDGTGRGWSQEEPVSSAALATGAGVEGWEAGATVTEIGGGWLERQREKQSLAPTPPPKSRTEQRGKQG